MEKFILYSAGYMDWRPVGIFDSVEQIKKVCIEEYGFDEEILKDDDEFQAWLEGSEMKYEKVKDKTVKPN